MKRFELADLSAWTHAPERPARARVLVAHGLGEHSHRHRRLVDTLTAKGFEVTRFDFRGCGESRGTRQWIERFEDYVEDLHAVRRRVEAEGPALPLFLYGHSLGGAIVIHYAARHGQGLAGLVLSAPAHRPGGGVSPVKIQVGKVLSRFVPRLRIPAALDLSAISRDAAVIDAYRSDPLNCSFNTLRQGSEILRALDEVLEQCPRISAPALILHGDADRLVLASGSHEILAALGSRDKRLRIFPGGYHELYHDNDREQFLAEVAQWLEAHLA